MTREEATRILDAVIPPPEHHTVDLDHLRIAQAWAYVKETLTAEPVKHGRWAGINTNRYGDQEATCSVCGATFASGYSNPTWWDYCPNCGARMDGGEDD